MPCFIVLQQPSRTSLRARISKVKGRQLIEILITNGGETLSGDVLFQNNQLACCRAGWGIYVMSFI